MNVIVFEDAGVSKLSPITTGRPGYTITCATFQLRQWLADFDGSLVGLVRTHLETLQLNDYPEFSQLDPNTSMTWLINARLVPSVSNIQRLYQFKDGQYEQDIVLAKRGLDVMSALIPTFLLLGLGTSQQLALIESLGASSPSGTETNFQFESDGRETTGQVVLSDLEAFEYPHNVVDQNMKCIAESLKHRISERSFESHQKDVYFGDSVSLGEHVVFDASSGPVVIDDNVKIGPFCFFRGPVYVGANSKISEHASIKDEVSISHTCKIGGELEATVIEAYSNKQHHGFLGHSYIGSWVNFGAGTCNSDLKNTYGKVNAQYGNHKVPTDMQFFGCVVGDYVKTAINTSIFTGKTIGTGSMVYGYATTNVPSFVNYARTLGQIGLLPPEVLVSTQERMFKRRDVDQRPCDIQLIHDMFRLTESERPKGLSADPPQL